jgi:hypothetical protein
LYDLDSVVLGEPCATVAKRPRRMLPGLVVRSIEPAIVRGYRCTTGLQTIIDLASVMDDITWEHALENALRNKLTTVEEIDQASRGVRGAARIRRVLALRPLNAPPTESLLETLMVQLMRTEPSLPTPTRQVEVFTNTVTSQAVPTSHGPTSVSSWSSTALGFTSSRYMTPVGRQRLSLQPVGFPGASPGRKFGTYNDKRCGGSSTSWSRPGYVHPRHLCRESAPASPLTAQMSKSGGGRCTRPVRFLAEARGG